MSLFRNIRHHITWLNAMAIGLSACLFAIISILLLSATNKNIAFIEKELRGLFDHRQLMVIHIEIHREDGVTLAPHHLALLESLEKEYLPEQSHSLKSPQERLYSLMLDIGDGSNLILDPHLSSYYLMNIVIRLMPEMVAVLDEKMDRPSYALAIQDNIMHQLQRSLEVLDNNGLETALLQEDMGRVSHALMQQVPSEILNEIATLYHHASMQLEGQLKHRLADEQAHYKHIIAVVMILFFLFSGLLLLVIGHYLRRKEYKSAQEKLQLLNQLEKTNEELEAFSYFTAHDLKEPVRTVSCFATLLETDLANQMDDKHKHYLSILRGATIRMDKLITDVLGYLTSSGRKTHLCLEQADMNIVVTHVLEDLQLAINESEARIICEALPIIHTDILKIRRVLQNVISNAIKYRQPDIPLEIRIRWKKNNNKYIFEVSDNGMGFDMHYAQMIFTPFHRLHDDHDKRGSGIGLSICSQLIAQLGGDIWVQSIQNQGTSLFFSLPIHDDK